MKTIEIVTTCWNPPGTDWYANLLRYQIGALYQWPPKQTGVIVTVWTGTEDTATAAVRDDFARAMPPAGVLIRFHTLPLELLFKRAVSRNISAKNTAADIVHFADADYFYGLGCADAIGRLMDAGSGFCSPERYWISNDHATGDEAAQASRDAAAAGRVYATWDPETLDASFHQRRASVAIGGIQFIGGNAARAGGYCDGTKHTKPTDPALGFTGFKCDKAFRGQHQHNIQKLPIPHLYRIRHSEVGTDFDGAGQRRTAAAEKQSGQPDAG